MSSAKPTKTRSTPPGFLWVVWLVPLVAGWLFVLKIHHWHLAPSTVILFIGWLAVLLAAGFLLQAAMAAVRGVDGDDGEFWRPEGRRDELLREKKSLLKAIKEIEFDHQLGKMSDEDAAKLSGFYRARAIEIMKVLDGKSPTAEPSARVPGDTKSVREQIEQDLAARLDEEESP